MSKYRIVTKVSYIDRDEFVLCYAVQKLTFGLFYRTLCKCYTFEKAKQVCDLHSKSNQVFYIE